MTTEMQGKNSYSRIITGREHKGDENGMTRYQTGLLKYKGKLVKVIPYPNADMCVYSSHKIMVYPKQNNNNKFFTSPFITFKQIMRKPIWVEIGFLLL